jgi:hypothetical protein
MDRKKQRVKLDDLARKINKSEPLGVTKGREALTSATVAKGWREPQVIRDFRHFL